MHLLSFLANAAQNPKSTGWAAAENNEYLKRQAHSCIANTKAPKTVISGLRFQRNPLATHSTQARFSSLQQR